MAATCDALSIASLVARKLRGAPFSLVRSAQASRFFTTICRDKWLGFKSLKLGFRIMAYGQGKGSVFKLRVQCLELGFT